MDETGEVCAAGPDRHLEGVEGKIGPQVGGHPLADDRPTEGIHDEGGIAEA
jgi:hypothetical protein